MYLDSVVFATEMGGRRLCCGASSFAVWSVRGEVLARGPVGAAAWFSVCVLVLGEVKEVPKRLRGDSWPWGVVGRATIAALELTWSW